MRRERRTTSIWGKAGKAAAGAAAASAAGMAAAAITGKRSRANPGANAASAGFGSIASELGGPIFGRFVRNLIGGLMR